jgi:predicted amidophosphoribosyltransferase
LLSPAPAACAAGYVKKDSSTQACDTCASNYYKDGDTCKECVGGASSKGGAVDTCDCSAAAFNYDTSLDYTKGTGCGGAAVLAAPAV